MTDKKLFNEWNDADDVANVDEIIAAITGMIADARNAWVLPFLIKQLEAFELLRKIPLKK